MYSSRELNEMSTEETSGDEQEVNEISRGRKWVSNTKNYTHNHYNSNNNCNSGYKQQQQRPRKTDKSNSGHKSQETPRSL